MNTCSGALYNLGSGSWLVWANDTAAIHCPRQRTIGPAVQHADKPLPESATPGLHPLGRKLVRIFRPAKGRRLSWPEHTACKWPTVRFEPRPESYESDTLPLDNLHLLTSDNIGIRGISCRRFMWEMNLRFFRPLVQSQQTVWQSSHFAGPSVDRSVELRPRQRIDHYRSAHLCGSLNVHLLRNQVSVPVPHHNVTYVTLVSKHFYSCCWFPTTIPSIWVTWRHRSRDHFIHVFMIGSFIWTNRLSHRLTVLSSHGASQFCGYHLDFFGSRDVIVHVTIGLAVYGYTGGQSKSTVYRGQTDASQSDSTQL